ncbi:MAG: ATP-binding cassette domain-containing protein [Flavobacteriaceae bacterium]|nr:ATP-binding cassette domain-containing protein [Flavobacteriaceae bacterium]
MKNILKIEHITKCYGKLVAVDQLSFEIAQGNVYGILGPNGSGKSTTLGILLNVVNKTSGNFSWFDGNLTTHEALRKVGAIIERPNFYPYMTAVQNLKLVCKIKQISENNINEKLKLVNLYERRNSKFSTFSLGMKQRLAIASALLNNPEVLILDEPTNGLDPQGIHEIRQLIQQIGQDGTTVLLASHLLDEVEKVCSHVIVLQNGKKLYDGKVNELFFTHGYFELKAQTSIEKLETVFQNLNGISKITAENGGYHVFVNTDISGEVINQLLFQHQIVASHLVKRKPSLEEQFLKMTNHS